MASASARQTGSAIVIIATIGAVIGLVFFHLSITVAVGIAVIGILIGTGVARGRFSATADSTKKN
jgi:hypothetical protein